MALPSIRPFLKQRAVLFLKVDNNTQIVDGSVNEFDNGTQFNTLSTKFKKSREHSNKNSITDKTLRFYADKDFNGKIGDKIQFNNIDYIIEDIEAYPDYPNANNIHHFEIDVKG